MPRISFLMLVAVCVLVCICCAGKVARGTKTTFEEYAGYTLGTPLSEFDSSGLTAIDSEKYPRAWSKALTYTSNGKSYPANLTIRFRNDVVWAVDIRFDDVEKMSTKQRCKIFKDILSDLKAEYAASLIDDDYRDPQFSEVAFMSFQDSKGHLLAVSMSERSLIVGTQLN